MRRRRSSLRTVDFLEEVKKVEKVEKVVALTKARCNFVKDLWANTDYFFIAPTEYDEKTRSKRWKENSPQDMKELVEFISTLEDFSAHNAEQAVMQWIADNGKHTGQVMNAFRLCVVGEGKGPHMFDITEFIGKEETIRRVNVAIEALS